MMFLLFLRAEMMRLRQAVRMQFQMKQVCSKLEKIDGETIAISDSC